MVDHEHCCCEVKGGERRKCCQCELVVRVPNLPRLVTEGPPVSKVPPFDQFTTISKVLDR